MNLNQPILPTYSYPNEDQRKRPPTKKDIAQTIKLFKDFHIPVPKMLNSHDYNKLTLYFHTYSDLEIYRRTYITNQLKLKEQEELI